MLWRKKNSHPFVLLSGLSLVLGLITACGVEVGNPGKPKTGVTDPGQLGEVEQKQQELLRLVEGQYDEALIASLESYALFDLGQNLELEGKAKGKAKGVSQKGRSCSEEVGGAVTLKRELKGSAEQNLSSAAVKDNYQRSYEARLLMQDAVSACKADKSGPQLDWAAVKEIQLEAKVQRTLERAAKPNGSGGSEVKSRLTSISSQKAKVERVAWDNLGLRLKKSLEISSEIKSESPVGSAEVSTLVATLKDKPIAIEEVYNAASQLESVLITSGSVSSEQVDGTKVQLDYENLTLDGSRSCRPLSGSIKGTVLAGAAQGSQFTLAFSDEKAEIVYEDGKRSELVLELCQIDDVSEGTSSNASAADAKPKNPGQGQGQGQGKAKE